MNLQELIESNWITKIETESTCVGTSYTIYVKIPIKSDIHKIVVDTCVGSNLDEIICLINTIVNFYQKK